MDPLTDIRKILGQCIGESDAVLVINPPATQAEIDAFSKSVGARLPTILRPFIAAQTAWEFANWKVILSGFCNRLESIVEFTQLVRDQMTDEGSVGDQADEGSDGELESDGIAMEVPDIVFFGDWGDGGGFGYVKSEHSATTSGMIFEWNDDEGELENTRTTLVDFIGLAAQAEFDE